MDIIFDISKRNKVISWVLTVCIVLSLFTGVVIPVKGANGITVGTSGSISAGTFSTSSAGGIINENDPIFRVGIQRDKELFLDGTQTAYNKVIDSLSKHVPQNNDSSLYFLNTVAYSQTIGAGGKSATGWFNTASQTLNGYTNADVVARQIKLPSAGGKPANVYKEKLKGYTSDGRNGTKTFASLGKDAWVTLLSTGDGSSEKAVWAYILANTSNNGTSTKIQDRITEYISAHAKQPNNDLTKLTSDQQDDVTRGMIDILMTFYKVAPTKVRAYVGKAINDYVSGEANADSPVAIVVDPMVNITVKNQGFTSIMLPIYDYMHMMGGVESKYSMYLMGGTDANTHGNSNEKVLNAVKKSLVSSPNAIRIAKAYNNNNPYSRIEVMMFRGKYLRITGQYSAEYRNSSLATQPYMELIKFASTGAGTMWGYMVTGYAVTPPSGEFKLKADRKKVTIPENQPTIGEQSQLDLKIKDVKSLQDWARKVKNGNATVKVKVEMTRTPAGGTYSSTDGDYFVNGYDMSNEDFLALMGGNRSIKFTDDISNVPIGFGEVKQFKYQAKVHITYKDGETTKTYITPNWTNMDYTSYVKGLETVLPEMVPEPITYKSVPETFSEIKEGTIYNESYEAMAGVPSTEKLYFAVGGSEFIVEMDMEYRHDTEVWRTYHSYFTEVDCEYKSPDTSPSKSVGGASLDVHAGDQSERTWSGSIPNLAVAPPPSLHDSSCPAIPDMTDFENALKEANEFAAEIAKTEHTHTAGSDGITRKYSGWSVSVSPEPEPPETTDAHADCSYESAEYDDDGNETSAEVPCGQEMVQAAPDGAGSFTITVRWSVPAHQLCGPCCEHILPQVNDKWKQKITYDHLDMKNLHVWKIEEGFVDEMGEILGEDKDELRAVIVQGNPNIFMNIAETESSKDGRLRYTVEPTQHDEVTWDEGTRQNTCNGLASRHGSGGGGHAEKWGNGIIYNNTSFSTEVDYHKETSDDKDKATPEFAKFDERRTTQNVASVISDMLILQTSSGDQSVIYFRKDSVSKQTQEEFPKVEATPQEMWDNNSNSASQWEDDEINIGSYNGQYAKTTTKYQGNGGNAKVETIFDDDPAKTITRPARNTNLRIFTDKHQIQYWIKNKSYTTGEAVVFYNNIVAYPTGNTNTVQDLLPNELFGGKTGAEYPALYSPTHSKVNDIIIHTPVSVEDAILVGLPAERDQRSTLPLGTADDLILEENKLKVCPLDPASCEFRVLNCKYHEKELLAEFDFEDGLKDKVSGKTYTLPSGFSIENANRFGTGKSLRAFGTRWSIPFSDIGIDDTDKTAILVEMNIYIPKAEQSKGSMIVSFHGYDFYLPINAEGYGTWNTGSGWEKRLDRNLYDTKMKLGLQISFGSIEDNKVFINGTEVTNYTRVAYSNLVKTKVGNTLNFGSWGSNNNYPAQYYMDNLKIYRAGGTTQHTYSCYKEVTVHSTHKVHEHTDACYSASSSYLCNNLPLNSGSKYNCNNLPLNSGGGSGTKTFTYTGGVQTFTAPSTGTYTLEVWGAEGGTSGYGGKGGYSKGTVNLTAGQVLNIYVGGQTGYNGGGSGHGRATDSGGGASDIRKGGTALSNRIIVAGGGGGYGGRSTTIGGDGGGLVGGNGITHCGSKGYGGSQTSGGAGGSNYGGSGTLGNGGSNTTGSSSGGGGGGGGYYGGGAGGNDYSSYNDLDDSSGGGGSGYVGGVANSSTQSGVRAGNGQVAISYTIANSTHTHTATCTTSFTTHSHTQACEKMAGTSLNCLYNAELNSTTTYNVHRHTSACGTIANYVCNGKDTVKTYGYTGGTQTYQVPATGTYMIETWGASGGGDNPANSSLTSRGGTGGYSKGEINLTAGQLLLLEVGGQGTYSSKLGTGGGYNGGGHGGPGGYGGGGYTSVTTENSTESTAVKYWTFDGKNEGFTPANATTLTFDGTCLIVKATGSDPQFQSPTLSYNTSDIAKIEIKYKNTTGQSAGQVFFSLNGSSYNETQSAHFTLDTSGKYVYTSIDLRNNPNWTGTLNRLRFDLGTQAYATGNIHIARLKLVGYDGKELIIAGGGGGADDHFANEGVANDGSGGNGGGLTGGNAYVSGVQVGGSSNTYTLANKMSLRDGTQNVGGSAVTSASGQGVFGPYVYHGAGKTLRITVKGSGLTNGRPRVLTNYGYKGYYSTNAEMTIIKNTSTEVVYEFKIPYGIAQNHPTSTNSPYSIWEFCYESENSNKMVIESTTVNEANTTTLGSGLGGTQNSGYVRGQGENATANTDTGGGGGGYYGGLVTNYANGGAGGGSGYVSSSLKNSGTSIASHVGNGQITITQKHVHTASCGTDGVKYTCGSAIKNTHLCLDEYITGVREYSGTPNYKGYKLSTSNGTVKADGSIQIPSGNAIIYGPYDKYYTGTYLVTIRGTNLSGVDWVAYCDGGAYYHDYTQIKDSSNETRIIVNVLKDTNNLEIVSRASTHGYTVQNMTIEPIDLKEAIAYCKTCKKNTVMKAVGTWVVCAESNHQVFDMGEEITLLTSCWASANEVTGKRITVAGKNGRRLLVTPADNNRLEEWTGHLNNGPGVNGIYKWGDHVIYNSAKSNPCTPTSALKCSEPHHNGMHYDGSNPICWDACGNDDNHKFFKPTVTKPDGGTVVNGEFVNIDYPFQIYFPNIGDFQGSGRLGISTLDSQRGKGYVNNMDTTKWTREKRVKFGYNVIYDGTLYLAGDWIELPVTGATYPYYDFYCVLANEEAKSATVEFEVEAINAVGTKLPDYNYPHDTNVAYTGVGMDMAVNDNLYDDTNRERKSDFTSLHGGWKNAFIDVVGRIGNFVMMDTEDYRFSNWFKEPKIPTEWLIDGFVKEVDLALQREYLGDTVDIRGISISKKTNVLDTYGTQDWKAKNPVKFPLVPDLNNITQLKNQPLRLGYSMFADVSTIGSYQNGAIQIVPYYFGMNLKTGQLTPLDAYMSVEGVYKPINLYDLVKDGQYDESKVYNYVVNMDWVAEFERRNYTFLEKYQTDFLAQSRSTPVINPETLQVIAVREWDRPLGRYINLGNAQRLLLGPKTRTFIGSTETYGENKNLGGVIPEDNWWEKGQRWHFKLGVPSSTVFVPHGELPVKENIIKVVNDDNVILVTADIQSIGNVYSLRYEQKEVEYVNANGVVFKIPDGVPPVIGVMSSDKSSVNDVTISGTH